MRETNDRPVPSDSVMGQSARADATGGVVKERYSAPDLHVVGTTETLVQGCGPHSGFDYRYYQTYCLE